MTFDFLIITLIASIAHFVGYGFGWYYGKRHGRDTQWVDDFLAQARREAARRDKLGRFKERNT